MATLDRQTPSVDTFLCEPWSSFVSAAKLRFVDSNQFPALEDFCLVVCHVCDQVVTPQGILTHYGKIPEDVALCARFFTQGRSHL
uniref:Uncharacterized protein n=1 Tax=Sparus aurata TaxID=8175 RepID=A0A671Z1I9_SPAAU